jgi:hypothetical protein
MTVMRAATEEWLLANPPDTGAFSTLALPDEAANNPFMDTLVFMDMGNGNISAIYVDDGSQITSKGYLHKELKEFVANGGVIEGYNP